MITPFRAEAAAVSGLHQADLVFAGSGAAGEVAGHGAQADLVGGRGLAHADAAVAARLMQPRPGVESAPRRPSCTRLSQRLPRGRVDVERDARVDAASADHLGGTAKSR